MKDLTLAELSERLRRDIVEVVDRSAMRLFDYSEDFIYRTYFRECPTFWPITDSDGNPVIDPDTGKPYSDEFNPEQLAYMLKNANQRSGDVSRIVRIWVDTEGRENSEKWQRIGRMLETFGCRPWSRLKSKTPAEIAEIIKK